MSSAQHTPGLTKSDCALGASLDSINSIQSHIRALQQRAKVLENVPGGRVHLPPTERIEYDLIEGFFCDLRAAISKASGSTS